MSNDIIEKKQKFGDVQFDSSAQDDGCIFCPTTINNRQQWLLWRKERDKKAEGMRKLIEIKEKNKYKNQK